MYYLISFFNPNFADGESGTISQLPCSKWQIIRGGVRIWTQATWLLSPRYVLLCLLQASVAERTLRNPSVGEAWGPCERRRWAATQCSWKGLAVLPHPSLDFFILLESTPDPKRLLLWQKDGRCVLLGLLKTIIKNIEQAFWALEQKIFSQLGDGEFLFHLYVGSANYQLKNIKLSW